MRRLTKADYGKTIKFNTCNSKTTCIKCIEKCVISFPNTDGYYYGTLLKIDSSETGIQICEIHTPYAFNPIYIESKFLKFPFDIEHIVELLF